MDEYMMVDDLQKRWQSRYLAIRALWDGHEKITKRIFGKSKSSMMGKMRTKHKTISKISRLLGTVGKRACYVFLGEAPGTSVLPFTNNKENIIYAQTYLEDLSRLEKSQREQWTALLEKSNVINLNRDVYVNKKPYVLDGDLMNPEMVANSIESALDETITDIPKILVIDAGVDPELIANGETVFDSWKILDNVMKFHRVAELDIIVIKIQNGVRIDVCHKNPHISDLLKRCEKFAVKNGYRLGFKKLIGSWLGNDEIYVCFSRAEIITSWSPLNSENVGSNELILLLEQMVRYVKNLEESINTEVAAKK